jgi:hypothetical protein
LIDNVVVAATNDNTWTKTGAGYVAGTYYWRVWARNADGENCSENTWKFTVTVPATMTLYSTDDSDVEEGYPTGVRGLMYNMYNGWSPAGKKERTYLKFDLSVFPSGSTIESASVWLLAKYGPSRMVGITYIDTWHLVDALGSDNDNWTEEITGMINWNNAPLPNLNKVYDTENFIGASLIAGSARAGDNLDLDGKYVWYSWDVFEFIAGEFAGNRLATIVLRGQNESDNTESAGWFYARNTDNVIVLPYLKVTYTPPPWGAVNVGIVPSSKDGFRGSEQLFTVNVMNTGGITENLKMTLGDDAGWVLTLSGGNLTVDNKLENMLSTEKRTLTLTVKVPDSAPIGTVDNVWVNATAVENTNVTDNGYVTVICTDKIDVKADSWVSDGILNENTYGTSPLRLASFTQGDNRNCRTFLKFPLSAIPPGKTIQSAKVWLYVSSASADDLDAQIRGVDNDNWEDKSITWNNQPPIGNVLDTQTLTSWPVNLENTWISWEVGDFVTGQRYYGDNVASFCIKAEVENTSGSYVFFSMTWTAVELRPKLVITFGSVARAVSASISPVHRIGDNGVTENFTVIVMNKGNVIDNYTLENTDNATWSKTLTPSRFDNVKPGESRTATLSVTIPGGAAPGAVDNIKVTARSMENTLITDSENCSASVKKVNSWVVAGYSPRIDNYGVAVTNAGNYIYVANSNTLGTRVNFMRYDPTAGGQWTYLATPSIATPFKNGTVLAWDKGNYIYALCGGSYSDNAAASSARHYFYRYKISTNTWENLKPTGNTDNENIQTGAQGPGDAMAVDTKNGYVYALVGNRYIGSTFWRYNIGNNTWENRNLSTSGWSSTDDGCSMVYTGGDYLYAFQGQAITVDNRFYRYSIPVGSWTKMADAPAGVDDGGSLLWLGGDNIYALLGGDPSETPRDNCFYVYGIENDNWTKLENLPSGIGDPNGPRLGFIGKGIYCWRGTQSNPVLWVYTLPTLVEQFSLHLVVGWNLIGFQITNADMTPNKLFAGTTYTMYYWTAPGGPYIEPPNKNLPVEDNRGYWVKENQDTTITFSGTREGSRTMYFVTGWNLVSFPNTSASTTPDKLFAGTTYTMYYWTAPGGPYIEPPNKNLPVEDNRGYWVKENQSWSVQIPKQI